LALRFYCLKCTKFGQLVLRRIAKIVAIKFQILRVKCAKFDFDCYESLQTSPDPLSGFKGPTSKGRERIERKRDGGERER